MCNFVVFALVKITLTLQRDNFNTCFLFFSFKMSSSVVYKASLIQLAWSYHTKEINRGNQVYFWSSYSGTEGNSWSSASYFISGFFWQEQYNFLSEELNKLSILFQLAALRSILHQATGLLEWSHERQLETLFKCLVRYNIHSTHQCWGEVTNLITNFKSPIFLF